MADKLADIDSRYRNRANGIWLEEKWQEADDKVSDMFGGFANKNTLFTKLSNMKLLKNNIIGSITGIAGRSDTIDALPSEVNKTIDALSPNQYLGTMRSILTEIGKYTDTQKMVNGFLSLTKNHEQHKQFISEQTRKVILNGFEKKGKKISKQLQTAITYIVLRTDLQVLANHYGNGSLAKLFNNSAYLDTEISKLEKTVTKHNYGKDKLTQAKKLADFMVTGNARTGMVTNPSAIAAGWGTSYKSNNFSISESNEIDRLISMYALRDQIARTNPEYITAIVEELNRSPDNGITRAIEIHSRLVKESKELFLDNPMSYVKGYMPDIVNKNIELQSVPVSKRAELEKKGWQYITDLHPDTVDTNIEPMVLMLIPDSGVQRVTSGALVLSDTGRKGTDNNSDMQASIKNMIKYMDTQNKKGACIWTCRRYAVGCSGRCTEHDVTVRGFVEQKYLDFSDETKKQIEANGEDKYQTAKETVKPEENQALYYTLTSVKEGSPSGEIRESMLEFASQFIGNPYVWGGTSLTDGADCSG